MKFLVRVDDFPWSIDHKKDQSLKDFDKFYDIISRYDIEIILGVIPKLCTSEDLEYLKKLKNVEVAMHGYDHAGESYVHGEFTDLNYKEKYDRLKKGREILKDFPVNCFIPPYDYFDKDIVDIIKRLGFLYITGRENCGIKKFDNGIIFLPSEMILYDKSYHILKNLDKLDQSINAIKIMTLHCTWEYLSLKNNNLELLCKKLEGKTISLKELGNPLMILNLPDYSFLPIATRLAYNWILGCIGQGYHILDIGSKDSLLPAIISLKGNKVISIDTDKDSLEKQNNVMKKYNTQYETKVMDAKNLQFDSESFDIVTASHAIQHSMDDDIVVVKEVHRVLKKGGRFLLVASFTSGNSYHWTDRKDPQRVNNIDDFIKRFVVPNNFIVKRIDYYGYDYGSNTGDWTVSLKANAVCLELLKE